MFVLFLMQHDEKLSVIKDTRSSLRPLRNGATSAVSLSVRGTCVASKRINTRNCWNSFNRLGEALVINIVKISGILSRLWVNSFNRQINLWQEYKMIACRRLIVEGRVKLDKVHDPWSIELQTKNVGARCSQLPDEEVLSIEAYAIEDIENQSLHCSFKLRCK